MRGSFEQLTQRLIARASDQIAEYGTPVRSPVDGTATAGSDYAASMLAVTPTKLHALACGQHGQRVVAAAVESELGAVRRPVRPRVLHPGNAERWEQAWNRARAGR